MSKAKLPKGEANKSLRSRVNFLQLAGAYLHYAGSKSLDEPEDHLDAHEESLEMHTEESEISGGKHAAMQRHLTSHMRTASQRSQVRLSQDVKHSFCKRCDVRLDAFSSCDEYFENKSSKARKPWADLKVVACKACGTQKRFPIGARRQPKKKQRVQLGSDTQFKGSDKQEEGKGPV